MTYSGGLSRSYVRTYAPARRYGFAGFSPYLHPDVVEIAEAIPFAQMTGYDVPALYALKGEIVRRGVKALTGLEMPVFHKRRFQDSAMPADVRRLHIGHDEGTLSPDLSQPLPVNARGFIDRAATRQFQIPRGALPFGRTR